MLLKALHAEGPGKSCRPTDRSCFPGGPVTGSSSKYQKNRIQCCNIELKRSSQKCRPSNLEMGQHHWSGGEGISGLVHQEGATGLSSSCWNRYEDLWNLHFVFILQRPFLWTSSASCAELYPSYRQKTPGFGAEVLKFLPSIHSSVAQKNPHGCTSAPTFARQTPSP